MNASEIAIAAGANTQKILDLVKEIKLENPKFPCAIMGYLNSIHGYNIEKYCTEAKKSMVSACIVVDSSIDCLEDQELFEKLKPEISLVKLVTPTNDENYIKACLKKTTSWIYVVSYAGVTGIKKYNINNIKNSISLIRKHSKSAFIGCGFGIRTAEDVAEVAKYSDAVICGTAIVDLIEKENKKGTSGHDLAKKVGEYVKELTKGLKK